MHAAQMEDFTVAELREFESEAFRGRAHAALRLKSCKDHERDGLEEEWAESDRDLRDIRAEIRVREARGEQA